MKGVLSKNRRHFGEKTRSTGVLLVPGVPIRSFILQLPFFYIFAVGEWFTAQPLLLIEAPEGNSPTHRVLCWALLGFGYIFGKNPSWVMYEMLVVFLFAPEVSVSWFLCR